MTFVPILLFLKYKSLIFIEKNKKLCKIKSNSDDLAFPFKGNGRKLFSLSLNIIEKIMDLTIHLVSIMSWKS